jgi:hypothetical protein
MKGNVLFPVTMEVRREGEFLKITGTMAGMKREATLPFEKGMILGGMGLPQQATGAPTVGRHWRVHTIGFNKLGGRPAITTAYLQIEEKVILSFKDEDIECYRVAVRSDPTKELHESVFYVNESGVVILEEVSIFGIPYRIELEEKREISPEEVSRLLAEWK